MGSQASKPKNADESQNEFHSSPQRPVEQDDMEPEPTGQTVPHLFRWAEGGESVFLIGTFNSWREKIPMQKSADSVYTLMLSLAPGYYEFKFIVDNAWRFSQYLPTTSDINGTVNNFVEILPIDATDMDLSASDSENQLSFSQLPPLPRDYSTPSPPAPPPLPPHFQYKYLPLNRAGGGGGGGGVVVPAPSHVVLNHVMFGSSLIASGKPTTSLPTTPTDAETLRVSTAFRFRGKFVTVVLFKPMPEKQLKLQELWRSSVSSSNASNASNLDSNSSVQPQGM